jgi:precorrin-2 C(20)-methyltransferase
MAHPASLSDVFPIALIGVGPGDPDLLTLRAARVIAECDVIVHAGPSDRAGFAYEVVAPLLRPDQLVTGMALVMKRGTDDGAAGYERIAQRLLAEACTGRRAAFLAEGDPMLFSTAARVLERLRQIAPEVEIEVVPGVSAMSAAAARLGWPLAQKAEILTVCPATYLEDEIGALLDHGGPTCWLKAASVLPRLVEELERRGRIAQAALVEKVGRPDERIFTDLNAALGQDLSYFSLVLVR